MGGFLARAALDRECSLGLVAPSSVMVGSVTSVLHASGPRSPAVPSVEGVEARGSNVLSSMSGERLHSD